MLNPVVTRLKRSASKAAGCKSASTTEGRTARNTSTPVGSTRSTSMTSPAASGKSGRRDEEAKSGSKAVARQNGLSFV